MAIEGAMKIPRCKNGVSGMELEDLISLIQRYSEERGYRLLSYGKLEDFNMHANNAGGKKNAKKWLPTNFFKNR